MNNKDAMIVVTGANRGIGLEIVQELLNNGYRVAACVRSKSTELDGLSVSGNLKIFNLDLMSEKSIKDCVTSLLKWNKKPFGLIQCAGIAMGKTFFMTAIEDIRNTYQVNLFGPLLFSQYLAKSMIRMSEGSIINIASTAGILADKGTLAYGGSKAALIHATRVMAYELSSYGIRVNAIAPSVVKTDMADMMDPAARELLLSRTTMKIELTPADLLGIVQFLLSPGAKKITGQIICIDGGTSF